MPEGTDQKECPHCGSISDECDWFSQYDGCEAPCGAVSEDYDEDDQ